MNTRRKAPPSPDGLAQLLRHTRMRCRVSQLELALQLESQRHVSYLESGRTRPSRALLLAWTYRVTYARKGVLQRDDAAFERVDSKASERQLLTWLAKELAATDWAGRIRGRLTALD